MMMMMMMIIMIILIIIVIIVFITQQFKDDVIWRESLQGRLTALKRVSAAVVSCSVISVILVHVRLRRHSNV